MKYSKFLSLVAACAVTAGIFAVAGPAVAADQPLIITKKLDDSATRRVSFGDLQLTTAAGVKALNRRVGQAVGSACDEVLGPSPVFYDETNCRSDSWSRARPQIAAAIDRSHSMAAAGLQPVAVATIIVTAR